jgi:uncharacterized protein YndB with AHSA1/START domain
MDTDGTLEQQDGRAVVRFCRRLAHPVDRVWAALTEPERMRAWWGDADVDLVEGGAFVMRWTNTDEEGNRAVMHATITELDPPRLLVTEGDMHGTLRWELEPDGEDATVLTFSSTLELPEEFRTKVLAGWHLHLDLLAEVLAGEAVDVAEVTDTRWPPIHEHYEAREAGARS